MKQKYLSLRLFRRCCTTSITVELSVDALFSSLHSRQEAYHCVTYCQSRSPHQQQDTPYTSLGIVQSTHSIFLQMCGKLVWSQQLCCARSGLSTYGRNKLNCEELCCSINVIAIKQPKHYPLCYSSRMRPLLTDEGRFVNHSTSHLFDKFISQQGSNRIKSPVAVSSSPNRVQRASSCSVSTLESGA